MKEDSIFKDPLFHVIYITIALAVIFSIIGIFVFHPIQMEETKQLHKMNCDTIKDYLINGFKWKWGVLDMSDYSKEFALRCSK